jgi:enterochelin esterase-like enzyme
MKNITTPIIFVLLLGLVFQFGYSQSVQHWDSQSKILEGSTVVDSIHSSAFEGNLLGVPSTQPVMIYLPPNYENFPNNRYPTLYLLHQFTTDYDLYFENFDIAEKLDRLISLKIIKPIIIVTPNAKTIYGGSWYTNTYVSGNWEDYITNDVIQHIENQLNVLDHRDSRGMAGFSSAGYGTMNIAMKYPSILGSIATIGLGLVDMELFFFNDPWKSWTIEAANINEFRPEDPWYIHALYSNAEAFAPDSTAIPILGRLPYTPDGELIDTTWQEWIEHDPITRIDIYKDSLLKLNNIQLYIGNQDEMHVPGHENFHQTLLDNEIAHGYTTYSGGHDPGPVIEDLLIYFSDSLFSVVPTIKSLSKDSLVAGDELVLMSDLDGSLYIVSDVVYPAIDSIIKYQLATSDIIAGEQKEINLSDFENGNFHVYVVSNDNMVSNIPEVFSIIPSSIINNQIPDFEIYPNPIKDVVNIKTNFLDEWYLSLFSATGQLISNKEIGEPNCQIDLSSFQKGFYVIRVRTNNSVVIKNIIKL